MRWHTRTTASIDVDGIEVDLEGNPDYYDPEILKPTPTTLLVGYLLYDQDCPNPMTEWDGEGKLYTKPSYYGRDSSITDDSSAPSYLGLSEFGSRGYDPEYDLDLDGIDERVAKKLMAEIKADPDLVTWFTASLLETGTDQEDLLWDLVTELSGKGWDMPKFDWSSEEDRDAISLLTSYEDLAKKAWEELYDEGKIGEYLAVPVYYCASCHGPGTASIYTTSLDDANAVWVPGKNEIANMNLKDCVTYADKLAVAGKYAEGCLKTYQNWCNGECYGVVIEKFVLTDGGEYEFVDSDSVWGFIGQDGAGAEEELKRMMEWEAKQLKEKEAA